MTVGAQRVDVLRLFLGDGVRLAAAGAGIGVAVALVLANVLKTYLFGMRPADPMTLGAMVMVVAGISLLAWWFPARRASRVDPMISLRNGCTPELAVHRFRVEINLLDVLPQFRR